MTGSAFTTEISFKVIPSTQALATLCVLQTTIVHVLSTSEKLENHHEITLALKSQVENLKTTTKKSHFIVAYVLNLRFVLDPCSPALPSQQE